jgi:hypothetical protein
MNLNVCIYTARRYRALPTLRESSGAAFSAAGVFFWCVCDSSSCRVWEEKSIAQFHCLTSAYVSILEHTWAYVSIRKHTSVDCAVALPDVSTRQHTSAYVSIRRHTSAYVSRLRGSTAVLVFMCIVVCGRWISSSMRTLDMWYSINTLRMRGMLQAHAHVAGACAGATAAHVVLASYRIH